MIVYWGSTWIPTYMIEYWGSTFHSPKSGGIYTIYNMPSLLGLGKLDPHLHDRILGSTFPSPKSEIISYVVYQETIIFPAPGNMRLVCAAGGSHLLLISIIIISNQETIIIPAPWQYEACLSSSIFPALKVGSYQETIIFPAP